jgi:ribulose-phosphate 3-epimerase
MLKCSTSLWSADLVNLEFDLRRIEPYSDRFHIDVADGHYTRALLFFPDLVKAVRKVTGLPLEVHLMTSEPSQWVQPFVEAGADVIIFPLAGDATPQQLITRIREHGKGTGVALKLDEPLDLVEPYLEDLDVLTIVGTPLGSKGTAMDPSVPAKIRDAAAMVSSRGARTLIEVDGGIRRETVPLIAAAGAHMIVPGSLMFRDDPADVRAWLAKL